MDFMKWYYTFFAVFFIISIVGTGIFIAHQYRVNVSALVVSKGKIIQKPIFSEKSDGSGTIVNLSVKIDDDKRIVLVPDYFLKIALDDIYHMDIDDEISFYEIPIEKRNYVYKYQRLAFGLQLNGKWLYSKEAAIKAFNGNKWMLLLLLIVGSCIVFAMLYNMYKNYAT